MLMLKRKAGESVSIGNDITITLNACNSRSAYFAIDAPKNVPVVRSELLKAAKHADKPTGNAQARLDGAIAWTDYGCVSLNEAARLEAIQTSRTTFGVPEYEWLIEVRREGDADILVTTVKVKTFLSAEVVS